MKILKVGDQEKAICNTCKTLVSVTYQLKDVPFSDQSGIVKDVLVGVCDCCNSVIVLPHQSTPKVKRQLAKQRASLEVRVPAHMIDILCLASAELGEGTDFIDNIIKYYLHALSNGQLSVKDMDNYLLADLAQGKAQKRLSLKGKNVANDVARLKALTHIDSTTNLIKSVVLKINDDILLRKNIAPMEFLRNLAAISG
jgi:hypothetical protein